MLLKVNYFVTSESLDLGWFHPLMIKMMPFLSKTINSYLFFVAPRPNKA
jgi:hypothetical protein